MKKFNIIALVAFLAVTGWMFFFRPDYVEAIQRGAMGVFGPLIKGPNTPIAPRWIAST